MNIWAWVEELYDNLEKSGQGRLANLLYQIPNDLHENRTERLEASVHEAIMSARALKHTWMEVFFRHWGLRNQLSNYLEGEKALEESIALMEFAHRDENIECPQSICVTQDLASCYGNVDGPGWVAERIAVIDETMARITPERNCWDCLSREKADALADDDNVEEALSFLRTQIENIKKAGGDPSIMIYHAEANFLQMIGRYDEALDKIAFVEDTMQRERSDSSDLIRNLLKATIYAKKGEYEKVDDFMPAFNTLQPIYYLKWVAVHFMMAMNHDSQRNNWQLAAAIQKVIKHFQKVGSHRFVIDMAIFYAKLAIARKSNWASKQAIEIISNTIPKLRRQDKAQIELNEIKALYENTDFSNQNIPATTPDEFKAYLDSCEESDPEMHIDFLYELHNKYPENYYVVQILSYALNACDMVDKAIYLLDNYFHNEAKAAQDATEALELLAYNLRKIGDVDKLSLLEEECKDKYPIQACLINCYICGEKQDYVGLVNSARVGFELSNCRHFILQRFEKMGNINLQRFDEVVRIQLDIIKDLSEEDKFEARWDLLTYAAAAQNWYVYRETCKLLELELPEPDDPDNLVVEIPTSWIWVRFFENGVESYQLAQRTGPTTARIKSVSAPNETQYANDWVAIDPRMVEEPPEDEEARAQFMETYDVVHIIETGCSKAIIIDGPRPTAKELDVLYDRFDELGWLFWRRSNNEYVVKHPNNEDTLQGLYFFIAVPESLPEIEVFNEIKSLTASFEYPLCWLDLAKKVNVDVAYHEGLKAQYRL